MSDGLEDEDAQSDDAQDSDDSPEQVVVSHASHGTPERGLMVSHHPITVLEDGTRVYSNGTKYKPKAPDARIYGIRKPPVEGAQRWGGLWLLPLPLLPGDQRLWPATRPDTDAYLHAFKPRKCRCLVCQRPEAGRWREMALRSAPQPPGL